ncbi:hypothetical protein [Aeromonas hydrophila]
MKEKLERSKEGTKGGISVRVMDIGMMAEDVALADESLELTRRRVNGLKAVVSQYYGTAMPAYIQALLNMPDIDTPSDLAAIFAAKHAQCQEWLMSRSGLETPPPLADRGAGCFANAMAAGRLAVELGILPFDVAYVDNAALVCFRRWIMSMDGIMDDVTREALQFMGKVAKNQHKLHQGRIALVTRDVWGFTENGRCYIRKAIFDDQVVSHRKVVKWLYENNYIERYAKDRYAKNFTIGDADVPCYSFDLNKLFSGGDWLPSQPSSDGGVCETEASAASEPPAPSFTRRATSETGCVMVESSPDMSEIPVDVEKF